MNTESQTCRNAAGPAGPHWIHAAHDRIWDHDFCAGKYRIAMFTVWPLSMNHDALEKTKRKGPNWGIHSGPDVEVFSGEITSDDHATLL